MLNFFEDIGVVLSLDGDRLKAEGLKKLPPDQAQEIRQKIRDNREKLISELQIPTSSPPGMGADYADPCDQAWQMDDFINDPDGASDNKRRARLPDLLQKRDRMAKQEQTERRQLSEASVPHVEKNVDDFGTYRWWDSVTTKPIVSQADCPARCKRTGKCYGRAWFDGKPGSSRSCIPHQCAWAKRFGKDKKR